MWRVPHDGTDVNVRPMARPITRTEPYISLKGSRCRTDVWRNRPRAVPRRHLFPNELD